jgi:hypothetical protein
VCPRGRLRCPTTSAVALGVVEHMFGMYNSDPARAVAAAPPRPPHTGGAGVGAGSVSDLGVTVSVTAPPGTWDCDNCTRRNPVAQQACLLCGKPPGTEPEGDDATGPPAGAGAPSPSAAPGSEATPQGTAPTPLPTISHVDLVELGTTVGSGSFGTVPLALWRGTTVALKKNREGCADVEAMGNEVALYAALLARPHPHILRVHGVCNDHPDRQQRLVMAYCEHGSLEAHLQSAQASVCFVWPARGFTAHVSSSVP